MAGPFDATMPRPKRNTLVVTIAMLSGLGTLVGVGISEAQVRADDSTANVPWTCDCICRRELRPGPGATTKLRGEQATP